ncbi:unnamed protein product [Caenorhabditis angaria]|uniref:Uncharacterized protein n=1 Tax=Caenorhabditis angaria TaxID=860376 RepID=A0A9P1N426_9PELO|nr:unnamed protein product [Caenorhabditis angaria]
MFILLISILVGAHAEELTGNAEHAHRLVRDFYKKAKHGTIEEAKMFLDDRFVYKSYIGPDSNGEGFIKLVAKDGAEVNLDKPELVDNGKDKVVLVYTNKNIKLSFELKMTINVSKIGSFKLGSVVRAFVKNEY